MLKKIVLGVTAILVIGLCVFLWKNDSKEAAQNEQYEEWNDERRPIKVELKKVEQQLENLNRNYEAEKMPRGTTQLIFTDLSEKIHSNAYPIMKEYGYKGVLAVSAEQLPGKAGCMSEIQFKELIEDGWTICVKWDEQILTNKWWNTLKRGLKELKMEPGNVVYFPEGTYATKWDSIAQQRGFSIVVIEKTDTENPLQLQNESGLWHIGAIGFMTTQPKAWLMEATAKDANITYLINFELEKQLFNEESFQGMMNAFDEYCASGDLMVSSIDEAREHYIARDEGIDPTVEAKYQEEKAALDAKISELKTKLQEIDAKYE